MKSVEVLYSITGDHTTCTDRYTCEHADIQIHPGGAGKVKLTDGVDEEGKPVRIVLYGMVSRIRLTT